MKFLKKSICSGEYVKIEKNTISVNGGTSGIHLLNINKTNVNENNITRNLTFPMSNSGNWAAIRCEGNTQTKLTCNTINPGSSNGFRGIDFLISNSKLTNLSCNVSNGKTRNGIEFTGACDGTKLERNEIGSHSIGLYYSNSAIVGRQPEGNLQTNGNKWTGTYNNNFNNSPPAVNLNNLSIEAINFNHYKIDANMGISFFPDNFPDNDPNIIGDWIINSSRPLVSACENLTCGVSSGPNGGNGPNGGGIINVALMQEVAQATLQTAGYPEETLWMLKKNLMSQLMNNDSLLYIDQAFLEFYLSNDMISTKQLIALEDTLQNNANQETLTSFVLEVNDSLLNDINQDMLYYGGLIITNDNTLESAWQELELLQDNYKEIYNINAALLNQIKVSRINLFAHAVLQNQEIEPRNYNEVLEKAVNDIYFRNFAVQPDSLENTDVSTLESIIHLCPQAGGNAVYRARAIYQMINDTVDYNDSAVCRNEGYFRQAMQEITEQLSIKQINQKNSNQDFEMALFPNPAKQNLNLIFNENKTGQIKIFDSLGKLQYSTTIVAPISLLQIDLRQFSNGIYYLQFSCEDVLVNKKFIKQ